MAEGENSGNGGGADSNAEPSNNENLASLAAEVFGFDDDSGNDAAASDKTPDGSDASGAGVGAGDGDGEGEAAAADPSPEPSDDEKALKAASDAAELERLRAENAELKKPKEEPKAKAEEQPEGKGNNELDEETTAALAEFDKMAPKAVAYKLTDDLRSAILSEDGDESLGAIEKVISGVLDTANAQTFQALRVSHLLARRLAKLEAGSGAVTTAAPAAETPTLSAEQAAELETRKNAYYDVWKTHKTPAVLPILQTVAGEFAAKYPNAPWDSNYINSLGREVEKRVKALSKAFGASSSSSLQPGSRSADSGAGDDDPNSPESILEMLG